MKINKTILVGILFIIIAGLLFITNALNPAVHPITHLFLMGSSKGKDIIFFGLMGVFLISSQLFKDYKIDSNKYMKISVILASLTLIAGILLEVAFRYMMGISLNTIFMTAQNTVSSTSILHTHLLKSILGELLSKLMGGFIESGINTGAGLYAYVPQAGKILIILLPILFVIFLLAIRNKRFVQTFLFAFFASCLLIGALDGGLFSTPAIIGICGIFLIYRNGKCIEQITDRITGAGSGICDECRLIPPHKNKKDLIVKLIKRYAPYIAAALIILLRFTIAFIGANTEHYEVDVINPTDNIELKGVPVENVSVSENKTVYIISSNCNEMDLLNTIKVPLTNRCDYFTETWNTFSYLDMNSQYACFLYDLKTKF